jgi:DNA-binding PadR family transcriptional regulator
MSRNALTDSELLVLGLVAEMPRHGYELEQVIEQRGMREWTRIGFSSIYFLLDKLERKGLIKANTRASARARKTFQLTRAGRTALVKQTREALEIVRPTYPSVSMGMLHWSVLTREEALRALRTRQHAVGQELERLQDIQLEQQPLPDNVDAMFEFAIGQARAEAEWIARTLEYMETKPWLA